MKRRETLVALQGNCRETVSSLFSEFCTHSFEIFLWIYFLMNFLDDMIIFRQLSCRSIYSDHCHPICYSPSRDIFSMLNVTVGTTGIAFFWNIDFKLGLNKVLWNGSNILQVQFVSAYCSHKQVYEIWWNKLLMTFLTSTKIIFIVRIYIVECYWKLNLIYTNILFLCCVHVYMVQYINTHFLRYIIFQSLTYPGFL